MKALFLTLLFVAFSALSFAQETPLGCGTDKPDPERFEQRFYYGDNQALIDKAYEAGFLNDKDSSYIQNMGFTLPEKPTDSIKTINGDVTSNLDDGNYSGIKNATRKYVPVQAYIWKNTAGNTPFTIAEINERVDKMNKICRDSQVPIRFYQVGTPLVGTANKYYDVRSNSDFVDMCGFPGPSAIKMHFVNSIIIDSKESSGKAQFPYERNSYAFGIAKNSRVETPTHEMGHALDLLHTHESARSFAANNGACGPCNQESVSRTRTQGVCILTGQVPKKCEVNGDGFCDTPADPELTDFVNTSTCGYTGTGTDNWGDRWAPDTRNIMSYAAGNCRNRFSFMQAYWMYSKVPSYTSTNARYAISGPFSSCPNQTLSFSVPTLSGVTNYRWEVPAGWTVSTGQGTRSVTIRVGSNPVGIIRVVPNYGYPEVERGITNNETRASINGTTQVCTNNTYTYSTVSGGSNYSWTLPSGMGISSGQGTNVITVYVYGPSGGTLRVSANVGGCVSTGSLTIYGNSCGSGNTFTKASVDSVDTKQDEDALSNVRMSADEDSDASVWLYPNPAREQVTLQFAQQGDYVIDLLDDKGHKLLKHQAKKTDQASFDVSRYPEGVYYFNIFTQDNQLVKRLYIK